MQRKLPKVPYTTKIGYSASELLNSVLGMFSNVIPIPTDKDLGIDMRAELLRGSIPVGLFYNVQCKGTEDVIIDEEDVNAPEQDTLFVLSDDADGRFRQDDQQHDDDAQDDESNGVHGDPLLSLRSRPEALLPRRGSSFHCPSDTGERLRLRRSSRAP